MTGLWKVLTFRTANLTNTFKHLDKSHEKVTWEHKKVSRYSVDTQTYLGPWQASVIELSARIVSGF